MRRLLIGAAAIALASWIIAATVHVTVLGAQIAEAETRLEPLRRESQGLKLAGDPAAPEKRPQFAERLHRPLSSVEILALLSQLAPDEMVLCSLSLEYPAPPPTSDGANVKKSKPEVLKRAHVQLEGVATVDGVMSSLIGELAERGFHNVRIEDNREGTFNGRRCYLFRTSMDIPTADGPIAAAGREGTSP